MRHSRQSKLWAHRAGYAVRLRDLESLYNVQPGHLLERNRHLRNVYQAHPGDVVFLPIRASGRDWLRDLFPYEPEFVLDEIEEISAYEAALIRAGSPTTVKHNGDNFVPIDRTLLQAIMDRCARGHIKSNLNLDVVADALNRAMQLAQATNRRREVGFLSQAVIETDYFRTFEEYGKGNGKEYGNYYGRGMHQLTWKDTYAACSKALFQRRPPHPASRASRE
jgi:hypothetical protein